MKSVIMVLAQANRKHRYVLSLHQNECVNVVALILYSVSVQKNFRLHSPEFRMVIECFWRAQMVANNEPTAYKKINWMLAMNILCI